MSNLLSFSSHFRFDKTQVRQGVQESLKVAFHLLARVWERQLAGEGREQFSLFRIPWAFQVGLHHFNNLKYIWLYQNQCNLDEETKKCEKRERERKNKWRHFSKPKNGGSGKWGFWSSGQFNLSAIKLSTFCPKTRPLTWYTCFFISCEEELLSLWSSLSFERARWSGE